MEENYFNEGICIYCGRVCKNQNSLRQHQIRCGSNPNKLTQDHKGRPKGYKNPGSWLPPRNKKISEVCPYCKELKDTTTSGFKLHIKSCKSNPDRLEKHLSAETKLKISKAVEGKVGGYKMTPNSTRSHRGYYKGLYCMSSWELAFVAYQIAKGKVVEQCTEKFPYVFEGKEHFYTPDFVIDGIYYEIKNWHRPETDSKLKYFPSDKQLILIEGLEVNKPYISYVEDLYGKSFWEVMYEKS